MHAIGKMQEACKLEGSFGDDKYFDSYQALTQTEIRRLWLAAGKKRDYELIDV